jgi:hypothetical protein
MKAANDFSRLLLFASEHIASAEFSAKLSAA